MNEERIGARSRFVHLSIILSACLFSTLYFLSSSSVSSLPFDDGFIPLVFADNLWSLHFFTFDGESPSTGATSLPHVLILFLFRRFIGDPIHASQAVGIFGLSFLSIAVYFFGVELSRGREHVGLLGALLCSSCGYLVYDALNGLETTLFVGLTVLTLALYVRFEKSAHRFPLFAVFLGVTIMTRPEGWFLAAGLFIQLFLRNAARSGSPVQGLKAVLGPLVVAGLTVSPYLLFNYLVGGLVFPNTVRAKMLFFGEYTLAKPLKFEWVGASIFQFVKPFSLALPLLLFAGRLRTVGMCLIFYATFFYLFYMSLLPGGLDHYWKRYQHIFLPFLMVGLAEGCIFFFERKWKGRFVAMAARGAVAVIVIVPMVRHFLVFADTYGRDTHLNEASEVHVATWLERNTPSDALVAVHDIGAVGYYSKRKLVDMVGLVNHEVMAFHRRRTVFDYLAQKRPDYVVMFPSWDEHFLNISLSDRGGVLEEVARSREKVPQDPVEHLHVYRCDWTKLD